MRAFSERLLKSVKGDAPFDEEKFEKNFAELDKNADGLVSKYELFQSLVKKAEQGGVHVTN